MDVNGTQRSSLRVSIDELTAQVKTRLKRMQYRPGRINRLLDKTGLDLQPP
jgi:putative transposase